jgi:hypothetical protein
MTALIRLRLDALAAACQTAAEALDAGAVDFLPGGPETEVRAPSGPCRATVTADRGKEH